MPAKIEFLSVQEASTMTGLPCAEIRRLYAEGAFATAIKHDGRILISVLAVHRFIKAGQVPELQGYSLAKQREAIRRFRVLAKFEELRTKYRSGDQYRPDSYNEATRDCGIRRRTIERWRSRLRRYGLCGLVDSRGGGKRCKVSQR